MVSTIRVEHEVSNNTNTRPPSPGASSLRLVSIKSHLETNKENSTRTITDITSKNKMSCSIIDEAVHLAENKHNLDTDTHQVVQQQHQESSEDKHQQQSDTEDQLTTAKDPVEATMTTADEQINENLLNKSPSSLNILNLNGMQQQQQHHQPQPTKVVQAGSQYIITTLFQGGSTQKVVTVAPSNNSNQQQQQQQHHHQLLSSSPPTITILNTNNQSNNNSANIPSSSSIGSSSSCSSSSSSSNSQLTTLQNQIESVPLTTTITLTSPNSHNNNNNEINGVSSSSNNSSSSQNLFTLQQHQQQQQQFSFVDTNQNGTSNGVSVFSPLGTGSSSGVGNNSYYTYQQLNGNYSQQSNLLTTANPSPLQNNNSSTTISSTNPQQQQQQQQELISPNRQQNMTSTIQLTNDHQQQQQQIYMMYQDNASIDMDSTQMDFDSQVAHTTQAAPITVQWLIDNFEPAEGCSLRRSTLYNYYLHHCTEQRLEPVNPASFGKLIRSVFLGLRTRRLGTRGNSKYHYYGIRVKITSPLNQLAEDHALAIRNHPLSLSPTGSPQPHQPPQSPVLSSALNSSSNSNGPTPNKRLKSNNNANSQASFNNNYNNEVLPSNTTEYKPVITTAVINNNNLQSNNENQHQFQQQQQQHASNQATPLMTVVLSSNGNTNVTKTAPTTTTIAKNLNKIQNQQQSHQQIHHEQQQQLNQNTNEVKTTNVSSTNLHHQQQQQQHQQSADSNQNQNFSNPQNPSCKQQQQQQQQTNVNNSEAPVTSSSSSQQQQQQHPPTAAANSGDELIKVFLNETNQMPNFGTVNLDSILLPHTCTLDDVKTFEELYKQHCEKILDMVVGLKLNNIENIWLMFWRSHTVNFVCYEEKLASSKFFALCEVSQIIEFVKQCDYQFYQFCIEILIPDIMGSLPHNLVQSIRSLAKSLENWLRNALSNAPDRIKESKLLIISTFSMTLRRYTSLNHLVQTVRNSLQNESILIQMLNDISRVDFGYIREQAKWTCECDERMVNKFEKEFKDSLKNPAAWSMDNWITWLDSSVSFYLNQFKGTDKYAKAARQFLLKWSFLCSSIVRDLTLRSAPSFGSFHLIRLLYDEYMYYIIEHKIANEYQQTPLAIMSTFDFKQLSTNHLV